MEGMDLQALNQFWLDYQHELAWLGLVVVGLWLLWATVRLVGRKRAAKAAAKEKPATPTEAAPAEQEAAIEAPAEEEQAVPQLPVEEVSLAQRFRRGLARTRQNFTDLFVPGQAIDADLLEELETHLLMADVGMTITQRVLDELEQQVRQNKLQGADAMEHALRQILLDIVKPCEQPISFGREAGPQVILVVGVNGVGKTTTIGKMARRIQAEGKKVMLAAGDTFRAAAVEQLQVWGERNQVPVVAQHTGADSASVIYDAVQSAASKAVDVVIADTAGRLHNKDNLMEELKKVTRVMKKLDETAPHEVLLVLDAATGQNALSQMREFQAAAGVTGVALTKLDGTAKGGVIFPLCDQFGVPVRFVGVGEGVDDLQPFDATAFVDALFARDA